MKTNNEQTINPNWISNDELDDLITASLERQDILEEINREVMSEVKRTSHRETMRRWARIAAFCFGVPFVLLCFGFGIHYIYTQMEMQPYMWIALALPTIAILVFLGKAVKNFSISKV